MTPPFDDPAPNDGPGPWSDEPEPDPGFVDTPMWLAHRWPHAYDRCVEWWAPAAAAGR